MILVTRSMYHVSGKSTIKISLLFLVLCLLADVCFAQIISSSELINNAKEYDGKTITYEGEVIGDIMVRGEHAWLNVRDAANAIGIWASVELIRGIKYSGSYAVKGDLIEVKGEFRRACSQHGGDLDIHAQQITLLDPGRILDHRLNPVKKNYVIVLLGVLAVVWILSLLKHS